MHRGLGREACRQPGQFALPPQLQQLSHTLQPVNVCPHWLVVLFTSQTGGMSQTAAAPASKSSKRRERRIHLKAFIFGDLESLSVSIVLIPHMSACPGLCPLQLGFVRSVPLPCGWGSHAVPGSCAPLASSLGVLCTEDPPWCEGGADSYPPISSPGCLIVSI